MKPHSADAANTDEIERLRVKGSRVLGDHKHLRRAQDMRTSPCESRFTLSFQPHFKLHGASCVASTSKHASKAICRCVFCLELLLAHALRSRLFLR
jgi:hypothetical protein